MNLFDLYAKISLDSSEYEEGIKKSSELGNSFANKLKSGLATAGKVAAAGIGLIATAATGAVGALVNLAEKTEEYRIAQGKLNTAFESAGYSVNAAKDTYKEFYGILGDTDTATEASQLLAKLTDSQEDLSVWTRISAGVNGTFGDSLPINGLIESANETVRVGQVTGVLADALNWASISEDEFNEKLAECSTESERNQLIMDTLSETYNNAADVFYKNNKALIESRNAQAQMDETLSKLGETVSNVKAKITADFLPGISEMINAFNMLVTGEKGAEQALSKSLSQVLDTLASKLPQFFDFGTKILISLIDGISANADKISSAVVTVITNFVNAVSSNLPKIVTAALNIVVSLAKEITRNANKIVQSLTDGLLEGIKALTDRKMIAEIIKTAVDLVVSLATALVEAAPKIVAAAPSIIYNLVKGVSDAFYSIVFSFDTLGVDLVKAIIRGTLSAITDFVNVGQEALSYMKEGFLNFKENPGEWVSGVMQKIMDKVHEYKDGLLDFFSFNWLSDEESEPANPEDYTNPVKNQDVKDFMDDVRGFSRNPITGEINPLPIDSNLLGTTTQDNSVTNVEININGSQYKDQDALAKDIARQIQNMTNRRGAAFA